MKKVLYTATILTLLSITFVSTIKAQDNWVHDKKGIYSVGLGATDAIFFVGGYHAVSTAGLSLNVAGEYKAWNWIGVGFQTGFNFYFSNGGGTLIGIPIAVKANAHILDAAGVGIADKLDVYAGLNIGGGPAFYTGGGGAIGFMQIGPQVGARYWVSDKVGVFGELGWGATFANVGVTF